MSKAAVRIRELESRVGEEIGVSPWVEMPQERIDLFAKATEDFQWIHVDPERARQSPFGTTIAHGFLTLSMLPRLVESTFEFSDRKMGVNYGLNKVRFTSPVPAGSRIRGRFTLARYERIEGNGVQTTWSVVMEREGGDKPVCVAETISRHYF
jgi:acyl dehydratase